MNPWVRRYDYPGRYGTPVSRQALEADLRAYEMGRDSAPTPALRAEWDRLIEAKRQEIAQREELGHERNP